MKITLSIREEGQPERTVALSHTALSIGRSRDCHVRLASRFVSRHHAHIDYRPGAGYFLSDNGSSCGTTVNHTCVQDPVPLREGDEIGMADSAVVVMAIDTRDSGPGIQDEDDAQATLNPALQPAAANPSVVVLPPNASAESASLTRVARTVEAADAHPGEPYAEALEAVREDFERFWSAVKARTPFSLAGEMSALRDAVDEGIVRLAQCAQGVAQSRERLAKLLEASRVIAAPLPLRERLETILDLAIEKLEADGGFLMLYSQRRKSLSLALQRGMSDFSPDLEIAQNTPAGQQPGAMLAREAMKTHATQFRKRHSGDGDTWSAVLAAQGIHGAICAPMKVKNQFLGLIYVEFRHTQRALEPLGPEDADWLDSLASLAALAIENARLIERRRA